jgi:hypothetical protein
MANAARGEVELELAGKTYLLVFDHSTLCEIESAFEFKRSVSSLFGSGDVSDSAINEAVRAAMARKNKPLASKQVARMISDTILGDKDAYARIVKAVMVGILAARGMAYRADELEQEETEEAAPAPVPTVASGTGET